MSKLDKVKPEILAAREKLKERMSNFQHQIGGKGTARRKIRKATKPTVPNDKKLGYILKKLGANSFDEIEDVMIFKNKSSSYLNFKHPKLSVCIQANTFVITGPAEEKNMDFYEMFKGLKNNSGKEAARLFLKKLKDGSEEMKDLSMGEQAVEELTKMISNGEDTNNGENEVKREDEIPALVEDFNQVSEE